MNNFFLFTIRLILSGEVAVIITRIFRPDTEFMYAIGLGLILVCPAYEFEYGRNRK
jgi:hypothetical protein